MPYLRILFIYAFLIASLCDLNAQPWLEKIKSSNPTFVEIQTAFEDYWRNKEIKKGNGYNVFKRWEWFWSTRLMPDGTLPPSGLKYQNFNEYLSEQSSLITNRIENLMSWESVGPILTTGPGYGGIGRVNCIAFHPTDVNTFWIGSAGGGLWKTTNGGATWSTLTDNLPVLGVSDIAINPTNPNIIYIATGDADGQDNNSVGVLKSIDGGITWSQTGLVAPVSGYYFFKRLLINPSNPNILIVATNAGIYRTTNAGVNWQNVQSGPFWDLEFKPNDPSIVYASTYSYSNSEIYRSTDFGNSWTRIETLAGVRRSEIAVTPADPSLLHVIGCNHRGGLKGLWKSNNSGLSFVQYRSGNSTNNILGSPYPSSDTTGQGWYDLAFTLNPTNQNEIWTGGINIWKSSDGGENWNLSTFWNGTVTSVPTVHADHHFFAFHPLSPGTLFDCNDGGLYKSTNGGTTWTDLSNGLRISQIYRLSAAKTVPNNVLIGLQDNGTKELENGSFFDRSGGDGMECIIDHTNASINYTAVQYGQIYKYINNSYSATIVNDDGTGVNEKGAWITPYVMHPTNNNTLILGKSQVWKTTNGGNTWSQLGIINADGKLEYLAYAPSNPQIIYAATDYKIFKSSDGGNTWVYLQESNSTNPYTSITVHPNNPDILFCTKGWYTTNNKVFKYNTTNAPNITIQNLSFNLPNIPVNCLAYQPNTSDRIFIGADVGIYYLDGGSNNWILVNDNLPNVEITDLEFSYDNKLWAATYGRGLWRTSLCNIAISTSGNSTFCEGGSVTLTSSLTSGNQWYRNGTPISGATGVSYLATTSGIYTVISNSNSFCGIVSSNTITVTVNPLPISSITATGSTTICAGNSVSLSASNGMNSYLWNTGATSQSITTTTAGAYTVTVTNANGCSATSNPMNVVVNPLPTAAIIATGPTTLCTGGSVVLNANTGTGLNYQWKKDGTNISGATSSNYTANSSGVYTALVTNSLNCNATSNALTVTTVSTPSTPIASTSGSTTFCQGGSVTLTSSATTGNQWYNNGTLISGATGQNYIAVATGVYAVNSTSGTCSSTLSNSVSVTVNPLPTPSITAAGSTAFCAGSAGVVLNATTGVGLNYQWRKDGTNIPGATAAAYTATASGNYSVAVSNSSNCINISNEIQVTSNPIPSTPSISWNGTQLTTTATGVSFQWYLNGALIPGATSVSHTPAAIGTYKVVVTANGCSNSSDNYTLVVTFAGGYLANPSNIAEVYPNPAQSNFVIKFNQTPELTLDVQLINEAGNILNTIRTKNKTTSVNVSHLPSGTYWIKINGGAFSQVKKIVITK